MGRKYEDLYSVDAEDAADQYDRGREFEAANYSEFDRM